NSKQRSGLAHGLSRSALTFYNQYTARQNPSAVTIKNKKNPLYAFIDAVRHYQKARSTGKSKYSQALRVFKKCKTFFPSCPGVYQLEVLHHMGRCYRYMGNFKQADKHYKQSLRLCEQLGAFYKSAPAVWQQALREKSGSIYLDAGWIYLEYYQIDTALQYAAAARSLLKAAMQNIALGLQAEAFFLKQNYYQAIKVCEKNIRRSKADRDFEQLRSRLRYYCLHAGKNIKKVIRQIEQLKTRMVWDWYILSAARYKLGREKKAAAAAEKILNVANNDHDLLLEIGAFLLEAFGEKYARFAFGYLNTAFRRIVKIENRIDNRTVNDFFDNRFYKLASLVVKRVRNSYQSGFNFITRLKRNYETSQGISKSKLPVRNILSYLPDYLKQDDIYLDLTPDSSRNCIYIFAVTAARCCFQEYKFPPGG
ncbi:MAG TPA: tetratricopeptide repeat protein, partial [Spirochaetota bacterium]|nr:tetratricopeptide repeat protein [Spirochaetota bacterium]